MFRLTTLLLAAAVALGAQAETILVEPDGPITIQAAIDASSPGDIIELADGVYTGPGNRDLDFHGKAITVRSQSGDPTACIIDCEGSDQDPHRAFIFENAEGPDAVVEGLTLRNGHHGWSGGIYSRTYCTPTIRNCRFLANHGTEGGGLCVKDAATIENCWFEGNVSVANGGRSFGGRQPGLGFHLHRLHLRRQHCGRVRRRLPLLNVHCGTGPVHLLRQLGSCR